MRKIISSKLRNKLSITILNLGEEKIQAIQDYESQKINELTVNDLVDNSATKFLADYRDLIGILSTYLNHQQLWATYIASKNRFLSKIPLLLQQIESCSAAIELGLDNFIIYRPDFTIVSTLQDLTRKAGFSLKFSRFYVKFLLIVGRCRAMIGHLLSSLALCHRLLLLRLYFNKKLDFDTLRSTYALKTFFYESTIDENNDYSYHDPMFGQLPQFLAKNGNFFIVTHILGNYKICLDKINKNKEFTIIPVEYWLSLSTIFKLLFFLIFYRLDRKIPPSLKFRGINVSNIFKSELFRKCNDIPLNQYIFFEMMAECFKTQKVDQYIHTYENNPWEKMAISAIREVSQTTKIVGFQHAVVTQSSANVFNSVDELYNMPLPDKIICVGQEPLDIMNEYSAKPITNIEVGCGLRYEYLQSLPSKPRKNIHKILIVPEGVPSVITMLSYVIRELNHRKEFQMTFRFHPSLPYEALKGNLDCDLNKIDNVFLSKLSLQDDLKEHDLCIYWGSTVALEALSMGIPLIHYDMRTILSYDPLFRCNFLKWSVTDNDSLPEVIETINSLSDEEYTRQADQAKAYIKRYFYPVTDENMSKFLYN